MCRLPHSSLLGEGFRSLNEGGEINHRFRRDASRFHEKILSATLDFKRFKGRRKLL
jgi:hypothetical protein